MLPQRRRQHPQAVTHAFLVHGWPDGQALVDSHLSVSRLQSALPLVEVRRNPPRKRLFRAAAGVPLAADGLAGIAYHLRPMILLQSL